MWTEAAGGRAARIRSSDGGEFDCYLAVPGGAVPAPAVVLASTVRGVDADLRAIADEFAAHGFIAAAPDLFWRALPEGRSRLQQLQAGERDMADVLARLGSVSPFNGRAAAMGFCYGGPYAIVGPRRLGFAAGISCHGTAMLAYAHELEGVDAPVCVMWGDRDHLADAEVLDTYRALARRMGNLRVHVFPGVLHGYMMPGKPQAFDAGARASSMARAFAMLEALRPQPRG